MHTEMKQEMWWMQSLMKVWVTKFYIVQEWQACPCSAPKTIAIGCLVFKWSKLKFRAEYIIYLMTFLKGTNIMQNRLHRGSAGVIPEGIDHHSLLSVKFLCSLSLQGQECRK